MPSNNLDKYENLTDEDLGIKSSTIEQTKFEYSLLGKIFKKGLDKDDQKEGLFKRLGNIKIKIKSSYKQLKINEKNNYKNWKILTRVKC